MEKSGGGRNPAVDIPTWKKKKKTNRRRDGTQSKGQTDNLSL